MSAAPRWGDAGYLRDDAVWSRSDGVASCRERANSEGWSGAARSAVEFTRDGVPSGFDIVLMQTNARKLGRDWPVQRPLSPSC